MVGRPDDCDWEVVDDNRVDGDEENDGAESECDGEDCVVLNDCVELYDNISRIRKYGQQRCKRGPT